MPMKNARSATREAVAHQVAVRRAPSGRSRRARRAGSAGPARGPRAAPRPAAPARPAGRRARRRTPASAATASSARRAPSFQRSSLRRVAAPALLARARRTGRARRTPRARAAPSRRRSGSAARAARRRAATRAHARPQHRGQHRERADLRAVQRRLARRAISSRWLTVCSMPEHGRRAPGDAHRDARSGRSAALRSSSASGSARWIAVGVLEHARRRARGRARRRTASSCRPGRPAAPAASRRARCRWRAGRRSPARLSSTGRAGDHVGSISSRSGQRDGVVRLTPSTSSTDWSSAEAVDAGGGLHDHVGEAEAGAHDLADVGDRARADAEQHGRARRARRRAVERGASAWTTRARRRA